MMSRGNQTHVFPVESQRTCLVPPATGYSLKTQHLRFYWGLVMWAPSSTKIPDAQRKADVQHKPHCLHNELLLFKESFILM